MTLRQQVCTLEQAKRLKELGCDYPCFFSYSGGEFGPNSLYFKDPPTSTSKMASGTYPAYTVAELGEMLVDIDPCLIKQIVYFNKNWLMYVDDSVTRGIPSYTEAEARAELLIHVLEQQQERNNNEKQKS